MLTHLKISSAKPAEKPFKLSGTKGLHLIVQPNGSKLWRMPSQRAGELHVAGRRCGLLETWVRSAPIPHPANRLEAQAYRTYVADGRYQSKPWASPIVLTTTVNHSSLISLNSFSLRL